MKTEHDGSRFPVPDPTALSTEQVQREVGNVREVLALEIKALTTRLDAMDKAINLVENDNNVFPNRIDEKISAMRGVHDERFRSISMQFEERDKRVEQQARDSKAALDAALAAAEKAVGKSEVATIKQMDQQSLLIQNTAGGLEKQLNDLKERLTRLEASGTGERDAKTSNLNLGNYVVGIIGAIIAATAVLYAILSKHP